MSPTYSVDGFESEKLFHEVATPLTRASLDARDADATHAVAFLCHTSSANALLIATFCCAIAAILTVFVRPCVGDFDAGEHVAACCCTVLAMAMATKHTAAIIGTSRTTGGAE